MSDKIPLQLNLVTRFSFHFPRANSQKVGHGCDHVFFHSRPLAFIFQRFCRFASAVCKWWERRVTANWRIRKPGNIWKPSAIAICSLGFIAAPPTLFSTTFTINSSANLKSVVANFRSTVQMGRRQSDAERGVCALAILFLIGIFSCIMVYRFQTATIPSIAVDVSSAASGQHRECCRGADHLELWGNAVKWGSNFKLNSSRECCMACKAMCGGGTGRCLCDSWVFCGNASACGPRFGEVWLGFLSLFLFHFWVFCGKLIATLRTSL